MQAELLKRNIKLLYLYNILISLIFVAPVLVPFMQSRGLSFTQIMFLQSLFSIASMLFEVPSGYLSDKLGRKKSIVIASVGLSIGNIIFYLSYSFWQFLAMEITFAFAYSMLSGTKSAIVYESLLELKQEKSYAKIWGDINFYGLISVAIASLIGGFIAKYSLDLAQGIITVPFIISIIVALLLKEPNVKKREQKQSIREDFGEIGRFLKSNMHVSYIIFLSAIIFWFNQSAFWLYQPYLNECGIDIAYYGVIFASFQIMAAIASKYAYRAKELLGVKRLLIAISLGSPISIALMGLNISTFGFVLIYAQQIARSFKGVVLSQILQDIVESHFRATLESIANLIAKLGFAIVLPIVGYALDRGSISLVLVELGVVGFLAILLVLLQVIKRADKLN